MSREKLKVGQRVWIVCNDEIVEFEIISIGESFHLVKNPHSVVIGIDINCPTFSTAEEAKEFIINNIKIIPYE